MSSRRRPSKDADQDYFRKLSNADREWLYKFNNEYYRGEFGDKPIHPDYYKTDCDKRCYRMKVDAMKLSVQIDVDNMLPAPDKKRVDE